MHESIRWNSAVTAIAISHFPHPLSLVCRPSSLFSRAFCPQASNQYIGRCSQMVLLFSLGMGASNSKVREDKALILCRERRRFVKQALAGRCLLAAAHVSYVQSLRNTGTALRKFVEHEILCEAETSMHASTSKAHEPVNSNSHFSATSTSLVQHVEGSEPFSPTPSPSMLGKLHVNHMTTARISSMKIEERLPAVVEATVQFFPLSEPHSNENLLHVNYMKNAKFPSTTFVERLAVPVRATMEASSPLKSSQPHSEEKISAEATSPGTPPWDYFGLFHPLDNQFSDGEEKIIDHGFDNADNIKCLREEEGIPELEDEGERASMDSGVDFDQISDEPLVQIYRNRNDVTDDPLTNASLEKDQEIEENSGPNVGPHHDHETSVAKLLKASSTTIALPMNGREQHGYESKSSEDFLLCIKEIEILFLKASDAGGEVPRMLEANKLQIHPAVTEEIAQKLKASTFFSSCFTCCKEEVHISQAQAQIPASNEMKYLPWHDSLSSMSSSSRIPFGTTSNDEAEDFSNILFGSTCMMNSGSHASTLDRLYAWERKLYDEVKASGFIRKEYDMKCRLLRLQDSRAESSYKIDKTRAAVKDLHSRIRVAIHRINSISKSIEELRDKELQPQLEELIGGLTRMWAMMLECHKNQHKIISDACNRGSRKFSAQSESRRHSTLHLQFELSTLCSSFMKRIAAHKSYLEAINNWLLKCILMAPAPKQKPARRRQSQFSPRRDIAPPIFVTCRDWLALLDELPKKQVEDSLSDLIEVTALFLPRTEKSNSTFLSAFSFLRRVSGDDRYHEIERNEASADWSLNYDNLQSGLVVFFDRLRSFAESSLVKHESLQSSIREARVRYENADIRV